MNGVKERPILMTGMMVRPTLTDLKRMTRRLRGLERLNSGYYQDRIGKVECRDGVWCFWEVGHGSSDLPVLQVRCPYGVPGDRLWVRETWALWDGGEHARHGGQGVTFRADCLNRRGVEDGDGLRCREDFEVKWRPSIHMPRWASRITLEVTEVRVERLQEITEEDAKAEGAEFGFWHPEAGVFSTPSDEEDEENSSFRDGFGFLWESINGAGSWEGNPWVWVISFRRVEMDGPLGREAVRRNLPRGTSSAWNKTGKEQRNERK